MLKIFFDGLCEPTNPGGVACYAFVVYEESSTEDRKIQEDYGVAAEPRPDTTHNLAEYTGLIKGLQWIRNNRSELELKIFGDSQLVIRQVTGEYKVRSPRMAPLHEKTMSILADLDWTAKWIPRRQNALADELTDRAYREYCMKKYGHSTRTLEDFLRLLEANKVETLADVRTIPRSRRNPQFNQDTLPGSLQMSRIDYFHLKELGGLRYPKPDSLNTGWRNLSFRGYADYMQTPEFDSGLPKLISLAQPKLTAIMCAEALPWRCHRWLISDALVVRGIQAEHILTEKTRRAHTLTEWALVEGKQITYPPTQTQLLKTA